MTGDDRAQVVVIGAGIVGNSVAYHLAQLGWRDVLLVDKGPLPNPGGSTGHASNFCFPVDYSKETVQLALESTRQYKELGVWTESGGIEVARTPERLEESRRRNSAAKAWGVDSVALLTPAEVKGLVPFINESVISGGFYTQSAGVIDSLRAGTIMRERAERSGALRVAGNTEVVGIDLDRGRVHGVRTNRGDYLTELIVICCGVWSPRIARMVGASIPLTPAVHQMMDIGPVPLFSQTRGEIEYPIVRDVDKNMYERQHGSGLEIGSYAHRPILVDPDEIPSLEEAALSPTELPFTQEDFEPQLRDALELMPEIVGDETVGVKHAINGLLSLTADGFRLLGELPEARGLWTASGIWGGVKEGPAIGKSLAEWITHGESEIDIQSSDVARFHGCQKTSAHVRARAAEGFRKTYGIVHPSEQWESNRAIRVAPFHDRERELGAVFFETAGWERPQWYESNAKLLDDYRDAVAPREAEWDARWWSPIINGEHLAMRERAGLFDLSSFCIFDVVGPEALDSLQHVAMRQIDVARGRVIYTPVLWPSGTFRSDLTVMRLGDEHFRVVTGALHGMADMKWFGDNLRPDERSQIVDLSSGWTTLGLWGPRARDIVSSLTSDDVSDEGFPFGTCRTIEIGPLPVLASRISYVGDLGWELYIKMEQGGRLWDILWEAGAPFGLTACGMGVYGTTGRLEKCYRAFGFELDGAYNVVEADMAWGRVKEQDFVGKDWHVQHRVEEPAALLCTLTVDDHGSSTGVKRYMLGREPILTREGTPLVDRKGRRSFVTTAGTGPSVKEHILMAYLPADRANVGERLLVEYMGQRYPVTVAVVGATPLFDPDNTRSRS